MKKDKSHTTTVTVRLTEEEYAVLQRLCTLKKISRTRYLARLATHHAQQELLQYAVDEYLGGRASLSELATQTGLDVPTIYGGSGTAYRGGYTGCRRVFIGSADTRASAQRSRILHSSRASHHITRPIGRTSGRTYIFTSRLSIRRIIAI
jgi:hypothetical protein